MFDFKCIDYLFCITKVSGICLIAICGALLIRSYRRAVGGLKFETVDLEGKVYIVTGSNTGGGDLNTVLPTFHVFFFVTVNVII